MKLLEYQAKELFEDKGLSTMRGTVLSQKGCAAEAIAAAGLRYPVVLKAQVQVGGRGKAGGIRFADTPEQAEAITDSLLFTELKGYPVGQLLVVEKAAIEREWYLSILLERDIQAPLIIFSAKGGMDIEETARTDPDAVVRVPVNPLVGITRYIAAYVCAKSGVGQNWAAPLEKTLRSLYHVFLENCCLLAEINPLAVRADGTLCAMDGKVEVDDDALYRLPKLKAWRDAQAEHPLVLRARESGFLYIPLTGGGRVAVISNGSGMLMSMIDLLSQKGIEAGCGLDLGGGATAQRIREALCIVLATPGVETLFICIFGGITRCNEVAEGVRLALQDAPRDKSVVVRMEGTNKEEGLAIIRAVPGAHPVGGIVEGVETIAGRIQA